LATALRTFEVALIAVFAALCLIVIVVIVVIALVMRHRRRRRERDNNVTEGQIGADLPSRRARQTLSKWTQCRRHATTTMDQ
jgi:uncharacterized membrane protein